MTGLIRATRTELVKTFTVRSWWLLALILLGYVGFTAGILALFFGDLGELMGVGGATLDPTARALIVYSSTTSVGYMFPALIGALAVTTEYRHRTLTPTLLAEPRRGLVLTGKALAATVIGAIVGVIGVIDSVGIGASVLSLTGADSRLDDPDVLAALARIVLAMALWAVIGVGLGSVATNQVVAIVVVLGFTQFLEPILRLVGGLWEWSADVGRFLPGAATDALVGTGLYSSLSSLDPSAPESLVVLLEWWQGGLVLAGFAVLLIVVGNFTSWRRDVQ